MRWLSRLVDFLTAEPVRVAALLRPRWTRQEEAETERNARELIAFVGLADQAETLAAVLPYGRQRLLEIARALAADPKLQELKLKADTAATDEEARKALRTYNKALFQKMRDLDPSIKERIDKMEAAVLRRLAE